MLTTKVHMALLLVSFVLLNNFLFDQLGIREVDDSPRYLEYAANIKEYGFYIDAHNIWYIGYPLFILGVRSIHDSLEAVVLAQYLFSFMGLIAVYFAAGKLTGNRLMALASAMLYLLFFEISIYNSYILCESLFVSMNAICLYFLISWYKGERGKQYFIFGGAFLAYTAMIKPTGIALIGAMLVYMLYWAWHKLESKPLKWVLPVLMAVPFVLLVNKMLETFGLMEEYRLGEIIYGVRRFEGRWFYSLLTVPAPENPYVPELSYPPLLQVAAFIFHHPLYWSKLFITKLFYYFAHVRPYWAVWHNLFSLAILIPLYTFAIGGLRSLSSGVRLYALAFISLNALSIGLTTVDWDGRFLLPLLPLMFVLAGKGVRGG